MKRSARILKLALTKKKIQRKNEKEFKEHNESSDESSGTDLSSPTFLSDFLNSDDSSSSSRSPLAENYINLNPMPVYQMEENVDFPPPSDIPPPSDFPPLSPNIIENREVSSKPEKLRLPPKNKNNKKRIRRKHRCTFCDQSVGDFSRHLIRNHADEISVQQIMQMNKKSKERNEAINKLRKEGDFCADEVVPVVRMPNSNPNYIPCKHCRGFYSKKSLRRHVKKCYYNTDDPKKRCNAQIDGQTLMSGHFGPNDVLRTSGILGKLKADDVSLVAKKDKIICEVARRYIRSHREKHLLLVAKRYMRRLARLLIAVRNIKKNSKLTLLDILVPTSFRDLINGTKIIADYNEKTRVFESPSLAQQMTSLIKHAINTAYSLEIQKTSSDKEKITKLKELTTLFENDWAPEISSEAAQNLNTNKFNKPTLIPATQDIMTFQKYLDKHIENCHVQLAKNSSLVKAYRELNEAVFCSLMLLNKRRVGELQRMTLQSFLQNQTSSSKEFEKALGESEKILLNSFKRVVIRGKRGRGVPVLFDQKMVQIVEYLISIRDNFELKNNIYLFGIPKTENPINGFLVMRKQAKLAFGDISKVSLLTSTKLRKHLATIGQILRLEKNDLEQLANFMGHTEKTHTEFYRLPSDVYQTAKVSKLLMLSKSQVLDERYKGKSLSEIEIEDHIEECDDSSGGSDDEEIAADNVIEPHTKTGPKVKRGPKRCLVAWTEEQKKTTEKFFAKHIRKKIPPKKKEVEELVSKNKELFKNKEWQKIKIYVCNQYAKK